MTRPSIFFRTVVFSFMGCVFCAATTAFAQGGTAARESSDKSIRAVVVIVSLDSCCPSEAWPEAEEKIKQEFMQGGIEVVIVNGTAITERDRRAELIQVAQQYQAAAAIRIVKPAATAGQAGVDLWITDRVTQKTVYRYLPLDDVGSGESSIVAGLKTMELFRGSLQEIHLADHPSKVLPTEIEQMTEPPAHSRRPQKPFRIGGGFSGIFFARDVGARGAPMAMFGWTPVEGLLLQLEGWFGMTGRDIKQGTDAASLMVNCVVLKPMWEIDKARVLRPAFGLLAGAAFVSVEGRSADNVSVRTERMTTPFFGLSSQFGFAVTESMWITPSFDMGLFVKRAAVMFKSGEAEQFEEVARFGVPVLRAGLLLDAHF